MNITTDIPSSQKAAFLRTLPAIRERCGQVFELAKQGNLEYFDYHPEKEIDVVAFCIGIMKVGVAIERFRLIFSPSVQRDFGDSFGDVNSTCHRITQAYATLRFLPMADGGISMLVVTGLDPYSRNGRVYQTHPIRKSRARGLLIFFLFLFSLMLAQGMHGLIVRRSPVKHFRDPKA